MKKKMKSFDAVEFMRRRRTELSLEYAGMSLEERKQRMREALRDDPVYQRLKGEIIPAGAAQEQNIYITHDRSKPGADKQVK
jgi:hypothetical protein